MDSLELILLLLASAVVAVVVFRSLQLPPLLGYLLVGIILGPNVPTLTANLEETQHIGEFGVVFLMFTIGLEFSLGRLFQMRRLVFGLGGLQVLSTLLVLMAGFTLAGFAWQGSFALAAALCVSSTAIVARMLSERMETETPHGREIIGVLLFQDLVIVPFLVILPALGGEGGDLALQLGVAALKAAAILGAVLFFGQRVMRWWFTIVAMRRSHELFIINVLFITLGLSYLTEVSGLSLALGAFVAGMLISETEYRHQVEEDIKPFRDVLLGLFFITMGIRLEIGVVIQHAPIVFLMFLGPMLLKFAVVAGLSRALGSTPGTAIRTALCLAQGGEFGLVLLALGSEFQLFDHGVAQAVIAGLLLSMLAAPFLIQHSDRIALKLSRSEWMRRSLQLHQVAVQGLTNEKHIVICGYGRTGQGLARFLDREGVGYVALDLDPERVQAAAAAGENVVYGDSGRREMLAAAGVARAKALVISFNDTWTSLRVIHHARSISSEIPIIVRTRDDGSLDELTAAGATEIVPDTFESSIMLASHALLMAGVPVRRVLGHVRNLRDERYQLLRGFYRGASDDPDDMDEDNLPRLLSISLDGRAYAVGKTLAALSLGEIGVEVKAVRRRNIRADDPQPETRFLTEDVVVLLGRPEALEKAKLRLLKG
ncbi:MAG TPA: cation:proton antiporter [Burkholderiales bacterium]|nr:cation:proton antiporter [Burkholderiales bacterium]